MVDIALMGLSRFTESRRQNMQVGRSWQVKLDSAASSLLFSDMLSIAEGAKV